jgi:type IX secretion system PorP/SprF family membrane protein
MGRILTLTLIFFASMGAIAQQAPQYSLYWLDPYLYNPATAGLENTLIATGIYRQQWSGLKGAPSTEHVDAHMPLMFINSGVGLKIQNDEIGAHRTTSVLASYDYQLELGKSMLLSVGASAGYMQYMLNGDLLRTPDGTYEPSGTFTHNDPGLPEGKLQAGTPILEAGVYLKAKKLEIGAAIQPVFAPDLKSTASGGFRLKPSRHYLMTVSYTITAGENLQFTPCALVKSDITETQSEISMTMRYRENIFAGVSFRGFGNTSKDAVVLAGGLRLSEKTILAYAFDISLSSLNTVSRGSHELMLRYSLNKQIGAGKLPPVIYNPRFF